MSISICGRKSTTIATVGIAGIITLCTKRHLSSTDPTTTMISNTFTDWIATMAIDTSSSSLHVCHTATRDHRTAAVTVILIIDTASTTATATVILIITIRWTITEMFYFATYNPSLTIWGRGCCDSTSMVRMMICRRTIVPLLFTTVVIITPTRTSPCPWCHG